MQSASCHLGTAIHRHLVDLVIVHGLAKLPPPGPLRGPDGVGDLAQGRFDVNDACLRRVDLFNKVLAVPWYTSVFFLQRAITAVFVPRSRKLSHLIENVDHLHIVRVMPVDTGEQEPAPGGCLVAVQAPRP